MKISDLHGRIGYHLDKEDLEIDENETVKEILDKLRAAKNVVQIDLELHTDYELDTNDKLKTFFAEKLYDEYDEVIYDEVDSISYNEGCKFIFMDLLIELNGCLHEISIKVFLVWESESSCRCYGIDRYATENKYGFEVTKCKIIKKDENTIYLGE